MPFRKRSSTHHRLAAILYSDIAGYTKLVGKDSEMAKKLVQQSEELHKPLIDKYEGHRITKVDDGIMVQFNSAINAVLCALEIQEQARANFEAKLHIGIHLGDVKDEEDGSLSGDAVNVALRLEALAEPGGIYISESVEKAIKGREDIQTAFLGELSLKDVDYGLKAYALQGEGLPEPDEKPDTSYELGRKTNTILVAVVIIVAIGIVYFLSYRDSNIASIQSIKSFGKDESISLAILPFQREEFVDEVAGLDAGFEGELGNALSAVEGFEIAQLQALDTDSLDISSLIRSSEANYIISGSMKWSRGEYSITVELIDPIDESKLWLKTYDQDSGEITEIHNDITRNIFEVIGFVEK